MSLAEIRLDLRGLAAPGTLRLDDRHRGFTAEEGDEEGLLSLLAADVVAYGDGGGKARAFPQPVHGRERVGRLLSAISGRNRVPFARWQHAEINGQPGALFLDHDGRVAFIVTLDIADDLIQTVRAVSNPDKLRHLDSLAKPS